MSFGGGGAGVCVGGCFGGRSGWRWYHKSVAHQGREGVEQLMCCLVLLHLTGCTHLLNTYFLVSAGLAHDMLKLVGLSCVVLCCPAVVHPNSCRDECPRRGMLMTALRVFEVLHAAVFAALPQAPLSTAPQAAAGWDVRNVMAAEKQRVSLWVVGGGGRWRVRRWGAGGGANRFGEDTVSGLGEGPCAKACAVHVCRVQRCPRVGHALHCGGKQAECRWRLRELQRLRGGEQCKSMVGGEGRPIACLSHLSHMAHT